MHIMLVNKQFYKRKYIKSHLKTKLLDQDMNNVLLLSSTNISPDVEKLLHNRQKQIFY